MSIQNLAEWANVSMQYLSKNKTKWCDKNLSSYAEYELVRGGVNILTVYDPYYANPVRQQIKELFPKVWGGEGHRIDTCKNAASKMERKIKHKKVESSTIYSYLCQEKRELYGVPKKRGGKMGSCRFVMCKFVGEQPEPFTEQEEEVRQRLMKQYLQTTEDQVITMRGAKESLARNEITKEEYEEIINNTLETDVGWDKFIEAFEKECNITTGLATLVEDNALLIYKIKEDTFEF